MLKVYTQCYCVPECFLIHFPRLPLATTGVHIYQHSAIAPRAVNFTCSLTDVSTTYVGMKLVNLFWTQYKFYKNEQNEYFTEYYIASQFSALPLLRSQSQILNSHIQFKFGWIKHMMHEFHFKTIIFSSVENYKINCVGHILLITLNIGQIIFCFSCV